MKTIGRREYIDFPELDIQHLEAKIDTGAYGCSIHCHQIEVVRLGETEVLRFKPLDPEDPHYRGIWIEKEAFFRKQVKNSGGKAQYRYVVRLQIILFGELFTTEFSLTNRKDMRYPVLLGRKFLKNRFLVDVSKKYISMPQNRPIK